MRPVLFVLLCLSCLLFPVLSHAQTVPRDRPQLAASADVNDAREYFRLAESLLEDSPGKAEQAFRWAARLSPGSADVLYGRYTAQLLADRSLLVRWMQADERAMRAKELIALDSLRLTFHTMDPFLFSRYERMLTMGYLNELVDRDIRRAGGSTHDVNRVELNFELETYLRRLGPEMSGWMAYTERRFADALRMYSTALRGHKDPAGLHSSRALAFYHSGQYDSAVAALKTAAEARSKNQKDKLVHIYQSQASYEYMIGRALAAKGDTLGTREAYARALLSDLSFYPAHMGLGTIDLAVGDTATALNSFKTAVDIKPNDSWVRWVYGKTLLDAGKHEEATVEFKQAVTFEPFFASPYYGLGKAADLRGDKADAGNWYRQFLERASKRDPFRIAAETRLRELGS